MLRSLSCWWSGRKILKAKKVPSCEWHQHLVSVRAHYPWKRELQAIVHILNLKQNMKRLQTIPSSSWIPWRSSMPIWVPSSCKLPGYHLFISYTCLFFFFLFPSEVYPWGLNFKASIDFKRGWCFCWKMCWSKLQEIVSWFSFEDMEYTSLPCGMPDLIAFSSLYIF